MAVRHIVFTDGTLFRIFVYLRTAMGTRDNLRGRGFIIGLILVGVVVRIRLVVPFVVGIRVHWGMFRAIIG